MKFTKRIIVMTFLAVTAAVSTGFAYDYVCNNSQYNCNTNIQYNSDNNTNNTNYATSNNDNKMYYRLLSYITRILFNSSKYS